MHLNAFNATPLGLDLDLLLSEQVKDIESLSDVLYGLLSIWFVLMSWEVFKKLLQPGFCANL